MIKKYKCEIIFFYAAAIVLLVVSSFCDLNIDIYLNNPNDVFSIWFQNTGEIPSRLICPLGGMILFYTGRNIFDKAAGIIISLGGSAYLGYYIGKYFFIEENKMLFSIIYGIGFGLVCLFAGNFITISDKSKKILRCLAITGIIVMFVHLAAVEIIKYLWGRVRFRDLTAASGYDMFTGWYQINGINGNKSFPSGHTAGAGMSFLMMLLPYASKRCAKNRHICFILPMAYTAVVAYTRLVLGAHYLSDVTAGAVISFTLVIAAMRVLEKRGIEKI